jgi:catechol 2,3-dioxygenase-like lactoylglutathione lyase family enzyme
MASISPKDAASASALPLGHEPRPEIRVRKIVHATFETPDLDRQVAYYRDVLGLVIVEKTADTAWFAAGGDHHSVVIHRGPSAGCVRLGFQVAPGTDLGRFEKQVQAHGISTQRRRDADPFTPDLVTFDDPKGTRMEVFVERSLPPVPHGTAGIVPHKLGHVAFNTVDVRKVVDFYVKVRGFRVSDWMADFFAFLRCGPDHHSINLIDSPRSKMNHIAFELRDWSHIETACDHLARHGFSLIWGPGRHGIGHNIFTYHRDPDGQIIELFTELDRIVDEDRVVFEPRPWHRDRPQRPKVWEKGPTASNQWGIGVPPGFLD